MDTTVPVRIWMMGRVSRLAGRRCRRKASFGDQALSWEDGKGLESSRRQKDSQPTGNWKEKSNFALPGEYAFPDYLWKEAKSIGATSASSWTRPGLPSFAIAFVFQVVLYTRAAQPSEEDVSYYLLVGEVVIRC